MAGLYTSILHKDEILALKSKLEEQISSNIHFNDLFKSAEFVLKNIFLKLKTKLSNRSLVLLLGLSLLLHTPARTWIKLRQIFLKCRSFNHLYDWDILTISFLFGHMEKQNWKSLWRGATFIPPFRNMFTSL